MNFVNILVKTHLLGEVIGKILQNELWSICLENFGYKTFFGRKYWDENKNGNPFQ